MYCFSTASFVPPDFSPDLINLEELDAEDIDWHKWLFGLTTEKGKVALVRPCPHLFVFIWVENGSGVGSKFKLGEGGREREAQAFRGTFGYGKGTLKYYMDTIWRYIIWLNIHKKGTFHPFQNVGVGHIPPMPPGSYAPGKWVVVDTVTVGLSSTLIRRLRSPKTELFGNAFQSGYIWRRHFPVAVWTAKTKLFRF